MTRRLIRRGDARVFQFDEPAARELVLVVIADMPAVEATAFSHRPWFRGGPLTAQEALRVGACQSIRVTGVCYTGSGRVVCDGCTRTEARASDEGWDQPIFEGGAGLFDCTTCGRAFAGEFEKLQG